MARKTLPQPILEAPSAPSWYLPGIVALAKKGLPIEHIAQGIAAYAAQEQIDTSLPGRALPDTDEVMRQLSAYTTQKDVFDRARAQELQRTLRQLGKRRGIPDWVIAERDDLLRDLVGKGMRPVEAGKPFGLSSSAVKKVLAQPPQPEPVL